MRGICDPPVTDVEISDVTADSRKAGKGVLYVATRGHRFDGNDFISDAIGCGSEAVVTDDAEAASVYGTILADDAKSALSRLCARLYARQARPNIVAVTGTNGKTTTAMATAHILSAAGFKTAVIGTVGIGFYGEKLRFSDGMTTPVPEKLYSEIGELSYRGAEYVIIEASSQGIAEKRLDGLPETGCKLKTAIFTNLSPEHLDYHDGMEDYFKVKSRLFMRFGFEKAIVNTDGKYGKRLAKTATGRVLTVGDEADYAARRVLCDCDGVEYLISSPWLRLAVRCPFNGAYTVENTMLAAVASLSEGIAPITVSEAIGTFNGVRGRMEKLNTDPLDASVYIDFAHTPEALRSLLLSARRSFPERKIKVLFGCGGDRDKGKRAVMGRIATELADYTVITSDNSRSERPEDIISDILIGVDVNSSYSVIPNRKNAIEYMLKSSDAGDLILLAGKGHEDYEYRNGEKTHFDEREIVREVIDKINGS